MEMTLEDGLALLDQCQFDICDPFELDTEIIQKDSLPEIAIKKYKSQAYSNWLNFTYQGESEVAICYNYLLDNIRQGKYNQYLNNYGNDNLDNLYNYFETTVNEETKHSLLWKRLVEKMYPGYQIIDLTDSSYVKNMQQNIDTLGLMKSLVSFFIGETVTLTTCSFLFQHSQNENKKRFLKIFLSEESKHLNGFNNLMQHIVKNISEAEIEQVRSIYPYFWGYDFDYFGMTKIDIMFDSFQLMPEFDGLNHAHLRQKIFNNVIENPWQQKFNKFIMHKNFLYYKHLFPNTTEDEFNNLINSKWIKYQN